MNFLALHLFYRRGRASIVTEADKYYSAETLGLDADNAKGLLDLYGEPRMRRNQES